MPTLPARFIEPMLLRQMARLREGAQWLYELKLDGYRAIAFKSGGKVRLRSRNDKDFTARYPLIAEALSALPDDTVIDGEVVALVKSLSAVLGTARYEPVSAPALGRRCDVFDVLILAGREVMHEPLSVRRELLQREIMPKLREPVRESNEIGKPSFNLLQNDGSRAPPRTWLITTTPAFERVRQGPGH